MKKDNVYKVEIKPKWELNFSAKFYLVCIIIFVLLVAYIQIYRHIHRDEIIPDIEFTNIKINNIILTNFFNFIYCLSYISKVIYFD